MPLPKEPEKELSLRFEKTGPVKNRDGVYEYWWDRNNLSKGGSTRDPLWWLMDFEKTSNLTYLFLASPNLEDEINFKGGRFVTSQNSKFWNVIINR